MSFMFL